MLKKIMMSFICFYAMSCFATTMTCPQAVPPSNPGFCSSFKAVAGCHCGASLPASMCNDMEQLYQRMLFMFGSVEKACHYQRDTGFQNCMDSWSCYRSGGKITDGSLCSGTGSACQ